MCFQLRFLINEYMHEVLAVAFCHPGILRELKASVKYPGSSENQLSARFRIIQARFAGLNFRNDMVTLSCSALRIKLEISSNN